MSLDVRLYAYAFVGGPKPVLDVLAFDANYTHNVSDMWRLAGCYDALYNSHGARAETILPALESGYADMTSRPGVYAELNPPNGWGDYETACNFLLSVINACRQYPATIVHISK